MINNSSDDYIYIFKCIVGSRSDVVKVGKTKHFYDENDRMKQHSRTPYYGFIPYTDFLKGTPIATGFLVKNCKEAEKLIKNSDKFKKKQFAGLEVYNIDYDVAIKEIYDILVNANQFIELKEDEYSDYISMGINISVADDITTRKKDFEEIRDRILEKYKDSDFPDELLDMLRDIEEFRESCISHYECKSNWIKFKGNLILNFNCNGKKRKEIYNKLMKFL